MNNLPKVLCLKMARSWPNVSKPLSKLLLNHVRTLYSPAALGIDTYVTIRGKILDQFASSEDKFKLKMAEFSEEGTKHMIFTEDLKSMVHLAEDKEEDLNLVHGMMRKFNKQNRELRFGSFVFGPVIMRMYHFLGKPDEALAAFKDESLAGLFDQIITYQILMDLLFINQRYNDMLEVFQIIKDKQLQPHRFPRHIVVLYFAACYKIDTQESYKLAAETWQDLRNTGHTPMRRAITFAAALALKQGAPHVALEILSSEFQQNYVTVRNLKAWALADMGRPDDVIPILRSVLSTDDPTGRKHTFTNEVMDHIREAMARCSDKDVVEDFQRLEKQLATHSLITNDTLDSLLCQEINSQFQANKRDMNQRNQLLAGSYNRRGSMGMGGGSQYRHRPGLSDLH